MELKSCTSCGVKFVPKDWQITTYDWRCTQCRRAKQSAWREERKASGIPVVSTKMPREYHAAYGEKYYANPSVKASKAVAAAIRRKDPAQTQKILARLATRNAIRRGDLERCSCEICGNRKVDAHHDDYSKPLDVRWLCRQHHVDFHAKATGSAA